MTVSDYLALSIPTFCVLAGLWSGWSQLDRSRMGQWQQRLGRSLWLPLLPLIAVPVWTPPSEAAASWISVTPLTLLMLGLVTGMAFILFSFSANHMAGDSRLPHYYRWLWLTLAAVSLTLAANHLLLFWGGWVSISLCLHRLLTYYPDRPRAILAAHKKFMLARTAELSLLVAIGLLYHQHQSFLLDTLRAHWSQTGSSLSWQDQIAACLIALAALIKCAQLPVHGWLIQVVEAPTPISALLHAGVVNLGGYLLIIFAPLLMLATPAQWLILIVAGTSMVLAALIMTTRISQKVRLAWSTSAQMGLMLLECALGLFELALLHLLAHSAYKAHAFLNAGQAVHDDLRSRLSVRTSPRWHDWLISAIIAVSAVTLVALLFGAHGILSPWLLLVLAMTLLIAERRSVLSSLPLSGISLFVLVASSAYGVLAIILAHLLVASDISAGSSSTLADVWAAGLFLCLFGLTWLLRYQAHRPAVQRLSLALFAGFYLDEWFTRITLKLWAVRMPANPHQTCHLPDQTTGA